MDEENHLIELEKRVRALERKISIYEQSFPKDRFSFENLLRARGITEFSSSPFLLVKTSSQQKLYKNLKSYYFRRFLGDVLNFGSVDHSILSQLKKKWGRQVNSFIETILDTGIAEINEGILYSRISVSSYGIILQWFVSRFLEETYGSKSIIDVKIKNFQDGGDIDVLSKFGLNLVMFECKSSPPNNIPVSELQIILKRVNAIEPDLFALLIDTTLSIKRNIIDNLRWILHREPVRIREGIYRFDVGSYIIYSKRDLLKNVQFVISNLENLPLNTN